MNAPHNLIVAALEVITGIHIDGLAFPHIVFTGSGARAVAVRDLVTCTQYRLCTNANGRQMRQAHSIMYLTLRSTDKWEARLWCRSFVRKL